jgi:Flp pilus assembly protein protease CpaA
VLIYLLLTVYMSFNLYTDLKYLITKNLWHLMFLAIGLCYALISNESFIAKIIVIFISLILGIALEKVSKISAGDTKMLCVSSIYLTFLLDIHDFFVPFYLIFLYLIVSSLVVILLIVIKLFKNLINQKQLRGRYEIRAGHFNLKFTILPSFNFADFHWSGPATPNIVVALILATIIPF